ncbi:M42 family metallopeptidase [bacterium]|nr:M42 family metallopeptidase [bacterium]
MRKESYEFLEKLLSTPSVSGHEQAIQRVVKRYVAHYADEVKVDVHGNLIASYNPQGKTRVMLAGHCDQIGMMVTHIDDKGFIYFNQVGGIDAGVLPGSNVVVHAAQGPIDGIIGKRPVHLLTQAERGKEMEIKKLWIDIGATNGEEVKKKVAIGDVVTYLPGVKRLGSNQITAPGCDDRVGVFVVMEALRLVAQLARKSGGTKKKLPFSLFAVSTVQEEIGLRGATTATYSVDPLVGIAVDVTHASDNPGADPKEFGTVKLGAGPTIARGPNINPVLEKLFVNTAKKKKIPYQPLGAPSATGTDANVIQISRCGVAAALIGLPNRYMHTQVEVVDLRDLENAARLIAESVLAISSRDTFIPS